MGFLGKLISATVKVAVSPLAAVKDIADGTLMDNTTDVLGSAVDDAIDSIDDLSDGDIL